jgi:glucans biosynthesis protein C
MTLSYSSRNGARAQIYRKCAAPDRVPHTRHGSARYYDIDAFRAALMLLAVLLHVSTVYASNRTHITGNIDRLDFFSWFMNGLHLFVTPSFFVISGLVTAKMITTQPLLRVAKERAKRLLLPMLSVALTFNVAELFLRYRDAGGGLGFFRYLGSADFAAVWQDDKWSLHLWFLVSLAIFVAFTMAIAAVLPRQNRFYDFSASFADKTAVLVEKWWGLPALILLLGLLNLGLTGVSAKMPGGYDPILPGLQSPYKLAQSLPYFAFGLALQSSHVLQRAILKFRWWMMIAVVGGFFAQPYPTSGGIFWQETSMLYAQNIVCWISVFAGLQFFHRFFNQPSAWRARWVDRAQSMFLFHHGLVYVGGTLLVAVSLPPAVEFFVLLFGVVAVVVILHDFLVQRIGLIGLLFNGRGTVWRPFQQPRPVLHPAE